MATSVTCLCLISQPSCECASHDSELGHMLSLSTVATANHMRTEIRRSVSRATKALLNIAALTVVVGASNSPLPGQQPNDSRTMPHIEHQNGRFAMFVEGKPYLILGAQINNSSAWPSTLPQV